MYALKSELEMIWVQVIWKVISRSESERVGKVRKEIEKSQISVILS